MNKENKWPMQVAIVASVIVYIAVIAYAEVMFLGIIHVAFPEGLMRYFATAGAISTGVASIVLLLSIHYWFSPGFQFVFGIVYWGVAVIVMILNTMLAFQLASGQVDTMRWWLLFSPSTPIINIVFIGILLLLDQSHQKRHAKMEFAMQAHEDFMNQLREQRKSPAVLKIVQDAAIEQATQIAGEVLSRPLIASNGTFDGNDVKPGLPKPTTVFGMEVDVPKALARKGRAK